MTTPIWKGRINGVLYGIQFDPVLDEAVVARVARGIASGLYPGDVTTTRDAINVALSHQGILNDQIQTIHTEKQIRLFLNRLSDALASCI